LCPFQAELTGMFKDFLIRFNRTYRSPEEQRRRFGIFTRNLVAARRLQETELGTGQFGVTRFSDWTDEEFRGRVPSFPPPTMRRADRLRTGELPESCDWRKAGAVSAVKDQKCGSCWAFAAVSNIESLWNIHFHQPRNLSVQEVLDCSWCGAGCRGNYVWDAFTTVLQMRGLTSEAVYPYKRKKMKCQRQHEPVAYIQGFEVLPGDEEGEAWGQRGAGGGGGAGGLGHVRWSDGDTGRGSTAGLGGGRGFWGKQGQQNSSQFLGSCEWAGGCRG
uniref:Cathepsin W n=1 Tax=Pelusios castaneus TaxID=367368 RepID=A0A8C8SM89_9SAUR